MTEVADFTQDDLDEDDVMLLDTWEEVGCVTVGFFCMSLLRNGGVNLGYAKYAERN